jgi:hypothetical protein
MDFVQFFGYAILRMIRELSPSMRVLAWQSAVSSAVVRRLGPKQFGGVGDLKPVLEDISSKTGKTVAEAMSYVRILLHRNIPIELMVCRH